MQFEASVASLPLKKLTATLFLLPDLDFLAINRNLSINRLNFIKQSIATQYSFNQSQHGVYDCD